MRRVLIVSPHFPPVNAPDMHRARMALPYLRALGWEAEVLAVAPDGIEGAVLEPRLEESYPADVRVRRVRALPPRLTRALGFGSLWWRAGGALRRAGDRLLSSGRFDLVLFSTTQFETFTLGPRWRRRFGVPYVLDYQDPWVNEHYRRSGQRPPGGWLRFGLAQASARRREPTAVADAAAILAVSPAYVDDLRARYPRLDPTRLHVLPFGASEEDFALARRTEPESPRVPAADERLHLVYAGRVVPGMRPALTLLFRALRAALAAAPEQAGRLRLHFLGTNYAPTAMARPMVAPLAEAEGVGARVTEHPGRLPYLETLHDLTRADAVLVLGSDEAGYNASKLHTCALAGPPLLAIAHARSPIFAAAREHDATAAFAFGDEDATAAEITRLAERLARLERRPATRQAAGGLPVWTARAMTGRLADIFAQAVEPPRPAS